MCVCLAEEQVSTKHHPDLSMADAIERPVQKKVLGEHRSDLLNLMQSFSFVCGICCYRSFGH